MSMELIHNNLLGYLHKAIEISHWKECNVDYAQNVCDYVREIKAHGVECHFPELVRSPMVHSCKVCLHDSLKIWMSIVVVKIDQMNEIFGPSFVLPNWLESINTAYRIHSLMDEEDPNCLRLYIAFDPTIEFSVVRDYNFDYLYTMALNSSEPHFTPPSSDKRRITFEEASSRLTKMVELFHFPEFPEPKSTEINVAKAQESQETQEAQESQQSSIPAAALGPAANSIPPTWSDAAKVNELRSKLAVNSESKLSDTWKTKWNDLDLQLVSSMPLHDVDFPDEFSSMQAYFEHLSIVRNRKNIVCRYGDDCRRGKSCHFLHQA